MVENIFRELGGAEKKAGVDADHSPTRSCLVGAKDVGRPIFYSDRR